MATIIPHDQLPDTSVTPLEEYTPNCESADTKCEKKLDIEKKSDSNTNIAIPANVLNAFSIRTSTLIYKYDKVGDYCRARRMSVEKYGIYPSINKESNKSLDPLFYLVKDAENREYKQSDFAHCGCVTPVIPTEPPSWKIIDPIAGNTLLKIPRIAQARNFVLNIEGNDNPVKLLLDRKSTCCCGDFRPCCETCSRKVIFTNSMAKADGDSVNEVSKSLYGGMQILDNKGVVIYENYDLNYSDCCDCIKCGNGGYYPGTKWYNPNQCALCSLDNCLSCCCCHCAQKPFTNHTSITKITGVEDKDSGATINKTKMTNSLQRDPTFHAHCTVVSFNGCMTFEAKIAVLLHLVDDRIDDEYDKENMTCYSWA